MSGKVKAVLCVCEFLEGFDCVGCWSPFSSGGVWRLWDCGAEVAVLLDYYCSKRLVVELYVGFDVAKCEHC